MRISEIGTAATVTLVAAFVVHDKAGTMAAVVVGILLTVFWVYLFRTFSLRKTVERNRALLRASFTRL